MINLNDAYEIARYIKQVEKKTPVNVYVNGDLQAKSTENYKVFGNNGSFTIIGDYEAIKHVLEVEKDHLEDIHMEYDRRNSAIPLYNYLHEHARIEPGAYIRDMVTIGKNAVVIARYIDEQLKEDRALEQLTLDKIDPFTGNKR